MKMPRGSSTDTGLRWDKDLCSLYILVRYLGYLAFYRLVFLRHLEAALNRLNYF